MINLFGDTMENIGLNKKMKAILNSKIKSLIFLDVIAEPKTFKELKKWSCQSTVSNVINFFEFNNIFELNDDDKYCLSSEGKIISLNYLNFLDSLPDKEMVGFWENHSIKDIPDSLFYDLNLLENGNLNEYDNTCPERSFEIYEDLVQGSKVLNIVLSVCSSKHVDILNDFVNKNSFFNLNLILNQDIYLELCNNYKKEFDIITSSNKTAIYIANVDFDIFLNVGDSFMSLNLSFKDGNYDNDVIFYDESSQGIKWGLKLFENCLEKARYLEDGTNIDI